MKLIPKEDISAQYDAMRRLRGICSGKKYYIRTFGCQQNEADSERLAGMACEMGMTPTDEPSEASLIIVNTWRRPRARGAPRPLDHRRFQEAQGERPVARHLRLRLHGHSGAPASTR